MQVRILSLIIFLSSLCPYLTWGGNNREFLGQMEFEMFYNLFISPQSLLHPMIIVPLLGQLMVIIFGVVHIKPKLVAIGIICLSVLIGFILFIGFFSANLTTILSCLPFLIFAILLILIPKIK